uniref:Uncharacterized protein n=1 Tax=Phasianus colchicus TaxID=9054 RepID=A0A669QLJ9_PHACC
MVVAAWHECGEPRPLPTLLSCALMAQLPGMDSVFVPSVDDFDKKLTEADAYLQIFTDQLKLIDEKLQNCKDDEQRKKNGSLKETINYHCWKCMLTFLHIRTYLSALVTRRIQKKECFKWVNYTSQLFVLEEKE